MSVEQLKTMTNFELHNYAFCLNHTRGEASGIFSKWYFIEDNVQKPLVPTYAFFRNACIDTVVIYDYSIHDEGVNHHTVTRYIKKEEDYWIRFHVHSEALPIVNS